MSTAIAVAIPPHKTTSYQEGKSDPESSVAESEVDADGEDDPDSIEVKDNNVSRSMKQAVSSAEESEEEDEEQEEEEEETDEGEEDEEEDDDEDDDALSADEGGSEASDESEAESSASEAVGAVKIPALDGAMDSADSDAVSEDESSAAEDEDSSEEESSDQESEAEAEWEAGSNAAEEAGAGNVDPNSCIFCKQDEMDVSGEESEELLACTVCGDHAHQKCAHGSGSLKPDDDSREWRCPNCVENQLQPDGTHDEGLPEVEAETGLVAVIKKQREAAPKLIRDLFPAIRGVTRPNSHSIFNETILEGDALDGSRSLRKRKSSTEFNEERAAAEVKRRKKSLSQSATTLTTAAPSLVKRENQKTMDSTVQDDEDEDELAPTPSKPIRRPARTSARTAGKATLPVARIFLQLAGAQDRRPKLVLALRLDKAKVTKILASRPRPQPRRNRKRPPRPPPVPDEPPQHFPPLLSTNYVSPLYHIDDRESNEIYNRPYGGILGEVDADTSRSLPAHVDRSKFESARKAGEELFRQNLAAHSANAETVPRATARVSGPPSRMKCISFGKWEIDTNYAAPYPEEYNRNEKLFICEFCLKYMASEHQAWRHKLKCPDKHPPGDEIYRDGTVSIFEVDGRKRPVYCQNLCLLAKLFLGSKTLYYDVEPFLFYVMAEYDILGYHFVGYFSKEKRPSSLNNVSCILTLPVHQRKGYGNLLIDFSYLLTRIENKTGSPEKPLSDMGLIAYRNYWELALSYQLRDVKPGTTLGFKTLSDRTGMTVHDIIAGLENLRVLVRDPVTRKYAFRMDYKYFEEAVEKWERKGYVMLNPEALVWTPYEVAPSNIAQYEHAPMQTVAPREEEDESGSEAAKAREESLAHDVPEMKLVNGTDTPLPDADVVQDSMAIDVEAAEIPAIPTEALGEENQNEISEPNSPSKQLNGDMDTAMANTETSHVTIEAGARPSPSKSHSSSHSRSPLPDLTLSVNGTANGASPSIAASAKHDEPSNLPTPDPTAAILATYTNIPPSRFELWPPVPGSAVKSSKKRNRAAAFPKPSVPASAVRTSGRNTPRRAAAAIAAVAAGDGSSTPVNGTDGVAITAAGVGSALRRATRSSRLAEEIVVGGSSNGGSPASRGGSRDNGVRTNGTGGSKEDEDDEEDEEEEGEKDEDDEDDADPDAEVEEMEEDDSDD